MQEQREQRDGELHRQTELRSVLEEDDIIVSGQSCSHRSHAAVYLSLHWLCIRLSVSPSVSLHTPVGTYVWMQL